MKRKSFSLGRFLYDNTTAFMMLGIFAFFSVFAEGFLSIGNITTVLSSSSVLLLVSIGMCFVVISGGTDLSVAAAYGLGTSLCVCNPGRNSGRGRDPVGTGSRACVWAD